MENLPPHQQIEATEQFTAILLGHVGTEEIKAVRRICTMNAEEVVCPCCGETAGARMIDLIDGHLALRELGLIAPPRPDSKAI